MTVGTGDLDKAGAFYDAIFGVMGVERLWESPQIVAWARQRTDAAFCVALPHDEKPASAGNGTMVAVRATDRAEVDAVHAKALALGAEDEGAPGPRGKSGFYGGYFRDLDGNKLVVYIPAGSK